MLTLKESRLVRVRLGLTGLLDALDAAGAAMRWVRHLCPARTPELGAWGTLEALLDALDAPETSGRAHERLARPRSGARIWATGWSSAVRAVRQACPPGRAAGNAARGGLVCRACGGAEVTLEGPLRDRALRIARGEPAELDAAQAEALLALSEAAMAAHASFDGAR